MNIPIHIPLNHHCYRFVSDLSWIINWLSIIQLLSSYLPLVLSLKNGYFRHFFGGIRTPPEPREAWVVPLLLVVRSSVLSAVLSTVRPAEDAPGATAQVVGNPIWACAAWLSKCWDVGRWFDSIGNHCSYIINVGYRLVWGAPPSPLNKFWIQNSVEKTRYRAQNSVK